MDTNLFTMLLNGTLSIIFLIIASRALYLYIRVRSSRLFILALSMGTITLTTAFDTFGTNISQLAHIQLNTDWFLFLGQTIGFLFFFLSLITQDQDQLHRLIRYQAIISLVILLPILFWPMLPALSQPFLRMALSGSRCIICFTISFYYVSIFLQKENRFTLLMTGSFLLLSFGYLILLPTYLLPDQNMLDHLGDILRICGLVLMFAGFTLG